MARNDFEVRSLKLLIDAHNELSNGIKSVGESEQIARGYVDHFRFWSSVYMNTVSQGFIHLRQAGLLKESRLLVRPVLELHIKQKAIHDRPDLIYRLGRYETNQDVTWLRAIWEQVEKDDSTTPAPEPFDEASFTVQLKEFRHHCEKLFPTGDLRPVDISIIELAQKGIGEQYYNSFYRTYCKFTHATMRVLIGSMDDITSESDNILMIGCVLSAVETTAALGGRTSDISALTRHYQELQNEISQGCEVDI